MTRRSRKKLAPRNPRPRKPPARNPGLGGLVVLIGLIVIIIAVNFLTNDQLFEGSPIDFGDTPEPAVSATATPGAPAPTPPPDVTPAPPGAAWYELFFTRPIYPDRPTNRGDAPLIDRFVTLLNAAQTRIDVAIYEFDVPAAAAALVAARQRGVQVRMVTDTDSVTSTDADMSAAYARLKAAHIPIVEDQRSAIMHDKFAVVDGRWVWSGSWNFTLGDAYRLNNNGILIDSPELAANYAHEFEQMFTQQEFGPGRQGALRPMLEIGGSPVRNYFSPADDIADKLVALVNSAQRSIYFLAFQFTQAGLGDAMAARARAGVAVSGVFETTGSETPYSQYGKLKQLGLPVYQDGNPYIMHHKVIIVDEKTVAFGSYNFSAAAESSNDENILIIDDPALAARFVQEFNYVRDVALNPSR